MTKENSREVYGVGAAYPDPFPVTLQLIIPPLSSLSFHLPLWFIYSLAP